MKTPRRSWKTRTNALLTKRKKKNLPLPSTPPENEFQCVHWIILNLKPAFGYQSPGKGLYLQNLHNHTIISQMWRLCTVIFSLSKWPIQQSGSINVYVYFLNIQSSTGLWGEEAKTVPVLYWDKYNRNIPVLQYNILAYNTADARMCNATKKKKKKLTYETILIWLRVLKCHNISGYNILSGL